MIGKPLLLAIALAASSAHAAQDNPPGYTKISAAYHARRLKDVEPVFGLAKVKHLVAHIKSDKNDNPGLAPKVYNALTLKQRFTYCMLNGEVFDQNCNEMPGFVGEERKIYAYPPGPWFEQYDWSARQQAFLKGHRGTIIGLLGETIRSHKRTGPNLNKAILFLDGWELVPVLTSLFERDRKNQDILSVLCILMKDGKYKPFLDSTMYARLYGDANASYKTSIDAGHVNQAMIISRAMRYYKSRASSRP